MPSLRGDENRSPHLSRTVNLDDSPVSEHINENTLNCEDTIDNNSVPNTVNDTSNDDIEITGYVPIRRSTPGTPTLPTLAHLLRHQHSQLENAQLERRRARERMREQRREARLRRQLANDEDHRIPVPSRSFNTIYTNPNTHIHVEAGQLGPISLDSDSDVEDVSESFTITEQPRTHTGMALSADEESINHARIEQRRHIREMLDRNGNSQTTGEVHEIADDNHMDDDEIEILGEGHTPDVEIVGESEAPDIQVLSSRNAGFSLYTPSGPLFVPSTETRMGGGIRSRFGTDARVESHRTRQRRNLRSFVRPDRGLSQNDLRLRQLEANRRAREAVSNGGIISEGARARVREVMNSALSGVDANLSLAQRQLLELLHIRTLSRSNSVPSLGDELSPMILYSSIMNYNGWGGDSSSGTINQSDEIPQDVMEILRSRDEARENQRINARRKVAERERVKKEIESEIPNSLQDKFSTDLVVCDRDNVCVLCGVTLLEGIPRTFIGTNDKEANKDEINQLLKENFKSPFNGCNRYTELDISLSRKVFFTSCGHMYCGRCMRNITSFRLKSLKERKIALGCNANIDQKTSAETDFGHPAFSAPLKCVAEGCSKKFIGKTPFKEVYL